MFKLIMIGFSFTLFVLFFPVSLIAGVIPNQSLSAIEYGFDMMETFDDLNNWQGSARSGVGPKTLNSSDFPKRKDGSDSPFNMYDYWVATDPGGDWIANHGSPYIWDPEETGTGKSICIDLSHRGNNGLGDGKNWGPSRFGLVWGDGMRSKGYQEMYVFFMVRFPVNWWPTSIDDKLIGAYASGSDLLYLSSGKFITIGHGFIAPWIHGDGIGSGSSIEYYGAKETYGWHPNILYLHPHNGRPEITFDIKDYHDLPSDGSQPRSPCEAFHQPVYSSYSNVEIPKGVWIGIEVRYVLNDVDGKDEMTVWYYDADGTEHLVANRDNLFMRTNFCLRNDAINMIFIGGNNSNQWYWGNTLDPKYYVDDFIINGSRIGPTYFEKKLIVIDGAVKKPAPPNALKLTE